MSIPVTFFSCGRPTESLANPIDMRVLIIVEFKYYVCQYLIHQDGNMFS